MGRDPTFAVLRWARFFLGLTLITGLLGFTGRVGSASALACGLCGASGVLMVAALLGAAGRVRPPF